MAQGFTIDTDFELELEMEADALVLDGRPRLVTAATAVVERISEALRVRLRAREKAYVN